MDRGYVMEQGNSRFRRWTDGWVIEQIVSHLGSLEGVNDVKWTYQSVYAVHQWLIRISIDQGKAIRLGVSFVEDEEDCEAFDRSFPPDGNLEFWERRTSK